MRQERYVKIVKVESYDGNGTMRERSSTDWLLIVAGIPILGSIAIFSYFLARDKKVYFVREKTT